MKDNEFKEGFETPNTPKSKQLVRMLSFRVVPAYFREIEKVADKKNVTVSKLIRTFVKKLHIHLVISMYYFCFTD